MEHLLHSWQRLCETLHCRKQTCLAYILERNSITFEKDMDLVLHGVLPPAEATDAQVARDLGGSTTTFLYPEVVVGAYQPYQGLPVFGMDYCKIGLRPTDGGQSDRKR